MGAEWVKQAKPMLEGAHFTVTQESNRFRVGVRVCVCTRVCVVWGEVEGRMWVKQAEALTVCVSLSVLCVCVGSVCVCLCV